MSFMKILIFIYGIQYGIAFYGAGLKYFILCIAVDIIYGAYLCIMKKPSLILSLIAFLGYAACMIIYLINGEIIEWFTISPETSLGGWVWLFSLTVEIFKPLCGIVIFGLGTVIQVLIFCMSLKLFRSGRKDN